MPVEGPGQALPHATKDDKVVPHAFKNIEKGQWVGFLKKGSHGARFSGLVSKVEKGKVTLTNTKDPRIEYTEDKNGNVKRQQNKGDVVFDVETVVGSWLIEKGGAKAKTPKERVQQRASGSRAERSKRALDVDEGDEEDGDEEEEDEEGDDEPEGEEGIVDEEPLSEEEEKPKKQDKGKGRRKKSLAQEFFQEADSEEDDPGRREPWTPWEAGTQKAAEGARVTGGRRHPHQQGGGSGQQWVGTIRGFDRLRGDPCQALPQEQRPRKEAIGGRAEIAAGGPQQPAEVALLSAERVHPRADESGVHAPHRSLQVQGLFRFALSASTAYNDTN